MTRQAVTATDVPPAAGPYSSAIKHNDLAFLSGQGPYDRNGALAGPDIRSQTRQTLDNLAAVALAAGCHLNNAVQVRVYLTTMENFEGMNDVYAEYFKAPYPARTTVETGLPRAEMLVEIDATVAMTP